MATSVLEILLKMSGADKAKREISGLEKGLKTLGGGMQKAGVIMSASITAPLVGMGVAAVKAASDLAESVNAVNVVFGEAAPIIKKFSETSAEAVGLSAREFDQLSAVTGAFLTNLGYNADAAAKETITLTERASDLASVFNTDVSTALQAVQSGLKGEFNPLEQFGVKMNAADIEAKALAMGLAETKEELDNNAKAQAALAIFMEQTDKIAGDFKNTSDGLANSTKIMKAELADAAAELGEQLLPIATDMVGVAKDLIGRFSNLSAGAKKNVIVFGGLAAAAGPALMVLGTMVKTVGNLIPLYNGLTKAMAAANLSAGSLTVTLGALAIAAFAVFEAYKKFQEVNEQVAEGMKENQSDWEKFFTLQVEGGKSATEVAEAYRAKQVELQEVLAEAPLLMQMIANKTYTVTGNTQALHQAIFDTSKSFGEYTEAMKIAGRETVTMTEDQYAAAKGIMTAENALYSYNPELETARKYTDEFKDATVELLGPLGELESPVRMAAAAALALGGEWDAARAASGLLGESIDALSDSMVEAERMKLVLKIATTDLSAMTEEEKTQTYNLWLTQQDQLETMGLLNDAVQAGKVSEEQFFAALADGIVTQEEVNSLLGIAGDELSEVEIKLNRIDGMTANATVILDILMGGPGTGHDFGVLGGPGGQHGLDFVVPPGFPNDSFPIRAESGERVTITPNYNLNIHTNAPYEPIVADFEHMRARGR